VRLAFAVAAHLDPEILIVDEVLAVGDAEFQKKCLGKMRDVSENEGRTVLFVSHYMPAVLNLCTHTMVLQFGKKIFDGAAEEGITSYLNHKKNDRLQSVELRSDRRGNGLLYCTNISFLNEQLRPVDSVKSGDEVNVRIDYKVRDQLIRSVAFRIQMLDANEQIVFTCNNEHSSSYFSKIDSDGSVICTIPRLPLFGGTYYINIQIYSIETGILDEVELAQELSVTDGDFFESGKIPGIKKGILVAHNWEINSDTDLQKNE
jgi:lipopolysaccharide transport system ATP-binding protein